MSPKEILVVDDEWDEVEILTGLLLSEGHRVQHAFDGHEALQVLAQSAVDLVVTDYMMPRMNGCELLMTMLAGETTAKVPVLMISALPEGIVRTKCAPVQAFLQKPFSPQQMLGQVRGLLAAVV